MCNCADNDCACRPTVVLGVDGGGTKTHYALYDTCGRPVDFFISGPTNHESLPDGFTGLRHRLRADLDALFCRNGLTADDVENAVLGLAGVDTKRQHAIISGMLRDIGLPKFTLCNDSFLGVKAGCPSGYGVCAINGTGFSIGGIDRYGNMLQVGGLGDYTGDEGGGGQLTVRAIRAVYDHLYKDAPATLLKDMIFRTVGITDPADYPETLMHAIAEGKCDYMEFGRLVFEAADLVDEVALELLDRSGREYARSVQGVLTRLDFGTKENPLPLELTLAGSVFVKGSNPRTADTMLELLQEWNPQRVISMAKLTSPPVLGAILWALEPYEIPDRRERIIEGLQSMIENA